MRIYYYIIAVAFVLLQFTSCQEEELDRNSIFTDEPTTEKNGFDQWLKKNYTDIYNIKLIYRLEDMETSFNYTLAPADFIMAQKLAKVVKYTWIRSIRRSSRAGLHLHLCPQNHSHGRLPCL